MPALLKAERKRTAPRVTVSVRTQPGLRPVLSPAQIRRTVRHVIKTLGYLPDCSVTVMLAGDDFLADLNRRFRGIKHPTDVLSFASGELDPETGFIQVGEIVLSVPRAADQARTAGHSFEDESALLIVHGTLHLFGFDHDTPARQRTMWAEQTSILEGLGPAKIKKKLKSR